MTVARSNISSCSNSTRGLFVGGTSPAEKDEIDHVTISSTGNAQDFGNLTSSTSYIGSTSSPTRGVFGGGYDSPVFINRIEYVTIPTTGNAADFGDLSDTRGGAAACSNGHGGL